MAFPAKKLEYYQSPKLGIIKGGNRKKSNSFQLIAIIALMTGIISLTIVNSADDTPGSTMSSEQSINWNTPPCSPSVLNKNWAETTHPTKQLRTDDKEYTNIVTGEVIEFHPYNSLKEYKPHWHRINPNITGKYNYYLDKDGNPVSKNSKQSHIYTDC